MVGSVRQLWWCERCKQIGAVRLDDHEAAMDAIYALDRDHLRISPTCPNAAMFLRVLNVDWLLDNLEAPEWAIEPIRKLLDL